MLKIIVRKIIEEVTWCCYEYNSNGNNQSFRLKKDDITDMITSNSINTDDNKLITGAKIMIDNIDFIISQHYPDWYIVNENDYLVIASNIFEKINEIVNDEVKKIKEINSSNRIMSISHLKSILCKEWDCTHVGCTAKCIIKEKMEELVSGGTLARELNPVRNDLYRVL